eukprot:gnl/MRDRNA2_/MRDRNA2_223735_c0_seq1.p2 gnl/MRDRNA2_/MRDRNA2_223735_c0~~gnl/MRDRNA2_/MRDRNA2_223735_c0_seq1.p2  ORF type:complete len:103 (+),score=9.15 gnl/MRDRNA2_/MRDRNA2_223735_c0_seq1:415-723(+)
MVLDVVEGTDSLEIVLSVLEIVLEVLVMVVEVVMELVMGGAQFGLVLWRSKFFSFEVKRLCQRFITQTQYTAQVLTIMAAITPQRTLALPPIVDTKFVILLA